MNKEVQSPGTDNSLQQPRNKAKFSITQMTEYHANAISVLLLQPYWLFRGKELPGAGGDR
jgi:hypothetical protein